MKSILLVDVDSKIPNIALMKLSTFYRSRGCKVTLLRLGISYYLHRRKKYYTIPFGYDRVYLSTIFRGSINYVKRGFYPVEDFIIGGTGYSLLISLPFHIENLDPDYSIYPENDISYGFISRGCIRNCYFCDVRKKEGNIRQANSISDIVRHKKVRFLDNNILALSNHEEILRELIDKNIRCCFWQGLDIRLINKINSELLSRLNYFNGYVFAFDRIEDKKIIQRKLELLTWRKDWRLEFFVYCNANMNIEDVIYRIRFLVNRKCFPYIMRDINCWSSKNQNFYTDLASWCNQKNLIKKISFFDFLDRKYTKNKERRIRGQNLYFKALKEIRRGIINEKI